MLNSKKEEPGFYSRNESSLDNWQTPKPFFELVEKQMNLIFPPQNTNKQPEFKFTLDPASTDENALTKKHFTKKDNGLIKSWRGNNIFLNPPYSAMGEWVKKAYNESQKENTKVVMILPPRTDTKYWHKWIMKAYMILYCKGRVNFLIQCSLCKVLIQKSINYNKKRICEACYTKLTKKKKSGSCSTFPLVIAIFKAGNNFSPITRSFFHKQNDLEKEREKLNLTLDKWFDKEDYYE